MDDMMRMVRENYAPPTPPTAHEIADGRRRLDALTGPEHRGFRTQRRRFRARWAIPAVGLAAAATAAAIAATSVGGGTGAPQARAASPRQILLAAADQAILAPVGRYWRTHTIDWTVFHVQGGYNVQTDEESLNWVSPSNSVTDVEYTLGLRARPLDLTAWRLAGSPTHWPLPAPKPETVTMARSTAVTSRFTAASKTRNTATMTKFCAAVHKRFPNKPNLWCAGQGPGVSGAGILSWQRTSALASNPQQLKQAILTSQTPSTPGSAGLFMAGIGFLVSQPMPPATQVAVYRLLADLPGVRSIGKVKDAEGRLDDGLAVTARSVDGYPIDYQALFDPRTHRPAGTQQVLTADAGGMTRGTIIDKDVLKAIGWTNDNPTPPAHGIHETG